MEQLTDFMHFSDILVTANSKLCEFSTAGLCVRIWLICSGENPTYNAHRTDDRIGFVSNINSLGAGACVRVVVARTHNRGKVAKGKIGQL